MNAKETARFESPVGSRPEVILEFVFDKGLLSIAVRNIGSRAARDIKINFSKKIVGPDGKKELSALPLFQRLRFLGPQREISCFLDRSNSYFRRRQPTKVTARVEYLDAEGKRYETRIDHDLEIYRELPYLQPSRAIEEE